MRLRVSIPTRTVLDEDVDEVVAEAVDGSFGLLPRHVDVVAVLVPGLLRYEVGDETTFVAVDGGTLVKCGGEVQVSTPSAIVGGGLEELRRAVDESFRELDERERRARSALARLESDVTARLIALEEHDRG